MDVEHRNLLCTPIPLLDQQGKQSAQLKENQDLETEPTPGEGRAGGKLLEREDLGCDTLFRSHIEDLVWQEIEKGCGNWENQALTPGVR